jgi:hypothetical protein
MCVWNSTILVFVCVCPNATLLMGKRPSVQRREMCINNRFVNYFVMDIFGSHQRLIVYHIIGEMPRSAHVE